MCVQWGSPVEPHQQIYQQTDLCQAPAQKKKQTENSKPNPGPGLNQKSVHTCQLFLTWMIARLAFAALPVDSWVSPESRCAAVCGWE